MKRILQLTAFGLLVAFFLGNAAVILGFHDPKPGSEREVQLVATREYVESLFDEVNTRVATKFDTPSALVLDPDVEERGIGFVDSHGDTLNGAVELGVGARAQVTDESIRDAPDNTVVRNVSIAIGHEATAENSALPTKSQAIAIGNHAKATAVNAIAIGSGVRHSDETDATGNNAVASAEQAISLGYNAKAGALGAVQIGPGHNNEPNSLKFRDTVIVKNGKLAVDPGVDTNAVNKMILDETEKGIMYGSIGSTNGFNYLRLKGYNAEQDSDPELVIAVNSNTNSPYAMSFPIYPGSPNRREIYSAETLDVILTNMLRRIEVLEQALGN